MDIAAIEPGRDFRKAIDQSVANCSVLLALIGRDWLDSRDPEGNRRLDNANDFVRIELASALRRDIPASRRLRRGPNKGRRQIAGELTKIQIAPQSRLAEVMCWGV
jgi:hypothetical protein